MIHSVHNIGWGHYFNQHNWLQFYNIIGYTHSGMTFCNTVTFGQMERTKDNEKLQEHAPVLSHLNRHHCMTSCLKRASFRLIAWYSGMTFSNNVTWSESLCTSRTQKGKRTTTRGRSNAVTLQSTSHYIDNLIFTTDFFKAASSVEMEENGKN